jgi:hypothetical protein
MKMPYGTMSYETRIVLNEQGITSYSPQNPDETCARIEVIFGGALDESFDVDLTENDVQAIVNAIFDYITSSDYAKGENVAVSAYETNGENYYELIYVRATENA